MMMMMMMPLLTASASSKVYRDAREKARVYCDYQMIETICRYVLQIKREKMIVIVNKITKCQ